MELAYLALPSLFSVSKVDVVCLLVEYGALNAVPSTLLAFSVLYSSLWLSPQSWLLWVTSGMFSSATNIVLLSMAKCGLLFYLISFCLLAFFPDFV